MREIGSEFWEAPISGENKMFPELTQWFLSGRSALQAIVGELKGCHTVAMPSWCCDSMIKPFVDAGISVCFYPVYYEQGVKQKPVFDCDILFVMDYFGYKNKLNATIKYNGVIIRDVTHSVFSTAYSDADYYFGSLRKWCGVWTGGYVWTKDQHKIREVESEDQEYIRLREKAMKLKEKYMNGQEKNKSYLQLYSEAESILEKTGIASAAQRDVLIAHKLDVDYIKSKRRVNAGILQDAFREWLIFPDLDDSDCPMFVPIIVPHNKRDELRKYLIQHSIYCPVHWPISTLHRLTTEEKWLYDNELSLVCDQRYSIEDMNRLVETIKQFVEE